MQFFMASTPPPKRTLRPRNITKSYKNTCGAPAPKATLKKDSKTVVTKLVKPKKASSSIRTSGDLVYTIKGPNLPLGAVSDIFLPFTLLTGSRFSGVVVAEMEGQLYFAPPVTIFPSAPTA